MVVDGREVTPAERRGVGMVFQDHALFPHMSARENIAFGLYGKPEAEIEARADEMLALVGLSERGDALPQALSGGQRQRVALRGPSPLARRSCSSMSPSRAWTRS